MIYRNKQGKVITATELEKLLKHETYKIVAQEIVNGYFVSTVWLGVGFGMGIHFFETMIFQKGDPIELYRYETLQDAEEGHKDIVKRMQNGWVPDTEGKEGW